MSILDSPCGLENVSRIAHSISPPGVEWDIYRYRGKAFVTKIEDPKTKRWVLVDCREKLTDDEIKDRISNHLIGDK